MSGAEAPMYHPKMNEFNKRMKVMFDEVDDYLEDTYGEKLRIHPNRPERGTTSNKAHDGVFNVGPQFTPGYGSEYGRGYVVDLQISTISKLDDQQRRRIEDDLQKILNEKIPAHFPERELEVKRDLRGLKIVGNFNLGAM